MGNCFSDPSSKKGKGQVLGSGPAKSTTNPTTASPNTATGSIAGKGRNTNYQGSSPATLGGSTGEQGSERERALAAAEERAKAASKKGVNSSNPNAGKLSSKLQEERKGPRSPGGKDEDRMMDRGQWN